MDRNPLIEKMLAAIKDYHMVDRGQKVLVGVSGGPDSTALIHALNSVSADLGIDLHVAHLNHSFRGKESDEDAEFVLRLSELLNIDCTIEKIDVPKIGHDIRLSDEEAARMIRYDYLTRVAQATHSDKIALAHTADDVIETSIMNYIRGTGLDGLVGIPAVREHIIRPFINIRRCEIEKYIQETGIIPRQDSSNLLPIYTRNKIRLQLLPTIRKEFFQGVDESILRLAELAKDDSLYLNSQAIRALEEITIELAADSIALDYGAYVQHPLAIRRRILRMALKRVRGDIKDITYRHIQNMMNALDKGGNFSLNLPEDFVFEKIYEQIRIRKMAAKVSDLSYSYILKVPGITELKEIGSYIYASVLEDEGAMDISHNTGILTADMDRIELPLIARNWMPGDRITPFGMAGTKKLQDIFTDSKISRYQRRLIPVIADRDKIVWVAGLVVSNLVKITDKTRRYLKLEFQSKIRD